MAIQGIMQMTDDELFFLLDSHSCDPRDFNDMYQAINKLQDRMKKLRIIEKRYMKLRTIFYKELCE